MADENAEDSAGTDDWAAAMAEQATADTSVGTAAEDD